MPWAQRVPGLRSGRGMSKVYTSMCSCASALARSLLVCVRLSVGRAPRSLLVSVVEGVVVVTAVAVVVVVGARGGARVAACHAFGMMPESL